MPKNPSGIIQAFFGVRAAIPTEDLDWVLENLGVPQPRGLLPVARTPGADLVCISTEESGRILFWDRKACWGKSSWSEKDFYTVAKDFNSLLSSLHEFIPENETELDRILRTNDISELVRLLNSGYPLESTDQHGRTLIENAAIVGRPEMIKLLFAKGARFRDSLKLAEQNLEFFPGHKSTVDVLKQLTEKRSL